MNGSDRIPLAPVGSPAARAAAAVRSLPMRLDLEAPPRAPDEALRAGWLTGLEEAAAVLAALSGLRPRPAQAFGGGWWLLGEGELVAPGVPAAVGSGEAAGPDGVYRGEDGGIRREGGGRDLLLVGAAGGAPPPGRRPDLLAFGSAERFLVAGGVLEVEDLFATLTVPAAPQLLERLLVRALRRPEAALEGLAPATRGPIRLTVRRAASVIGDRWRDPSAVLAARAEAEGVRWAGDELELSCVDGRRLRFSVRSGAEGWRAELCAGEHPLRAHALALEPGSDVVAYCAEIDAAEDPFAAGRRGRLAFDLYSVLVALGAG